LLAKSLLTDTDLSIADVAMAAGFGSIRRFNDLFHTQYRLSPTALRKHAAAGLAGEVASGQMTVALGYRPPYSWEQIRDFLGSRAIAGVEKVENDCYWRTVSLPAPTKGRSQQGDNELTHAGARLHGWLRVGNDPRRNRLVVAVSYSLLPAIPQVLARVRLLFDLACGPQAVHEGLLSLNDIAPGLNALGTRVPGSFDAFEMTVRAVLGQQITVKAAGTLAARLAQAYGAPIDTGIEGLTHVFPSSRDILVLGGSDPSSAQLAEQVGAQPTEQVGAQLAEQAGAQPTEPPSTQLADRLGPLGIIASRSRTIFALAAALEAGTLDLSSSAQAEEQLALLQTLPGIGPWTAHYIAMRALNWPDAFLPTDYGVKKALPGRTPREIEALAEAWRPWRAYATMNLWQSLH
jgi:AraC family transcriptional regulator of adaptative response / DNA-3-methyladenine glycosylase II